VSLPSSWHLHLPPPANTRGYLVTHQISQPNWLSYHRDPKTVRMKNVRVFSFSSCFETNLRRDFELRFLQPNGMISLKIQL
jgi:hypothetical protein